MFRPFLTCLIFASLCSLALADNPSTAPSTQPSPEVNALITQMSSDDFSQRTSAQTKLVAMGEGILPQVRQALAGDLPDEARARIKAAISQIQDNVLLGPSFYTMHYKDAPLQTILDDFAAQAGADLGVHRPRITEYAKTRTASIDLNHASFWDALRAIEDVSGLQTQPYSNVGGMVLDINPGIFPDFDMFADSSCTSGPLRIFAQSCQDNRMIQYGRGGAGRKMSTFMLSLVVVPEPKLRVSGSINGDWLTECVDEHGISLLSDEPQQIYANNARQWWWQLQAGLKEQPNMGHKIATLRGVLKFNVQCKIDDLEVDLPKLHDLTRTVGVNTVTIHEFRGMQGQYQLLLSVSGPGLVGRTMWETVTTASSSIQILDQTGQPYMQMGVAPQFRPGAKTMDVILSYISPRMMNGPALGPPAKLKWEVATEVRQVSAPFVLHDLELPTAP